jgi:hypothetical protein
MAKGDDIPLETFSKVVESIYDCALDVTHWQETIGMIADVFQCPCGALGITHMNEVRNEAMFHVGVDEHFGRLYAETYNALNPHSVPLQLVPVGKVITTPMVVGEPRA